MRRSAKWLLAGGSAGVAAAAAAAYGLMVRPRHLVWGATTEEVERPLPFDSMIESPNYFTTRAMTIDATSDEIWPFLIDTAILPRGTVIRHATEKESILFAHPGFEEEATWVVVLVPQPDGRTRLLSRTRARFERRAPSVLRYLLLDPAQFVCERAWMNRVRNSAEELARSIRITAPMETAPAEETPSESDSAVSDAPPVTLDEIEADPSATVTV